MLTSIGFTINLQKLKMNEFSDTDSQVNVLEAFFFFSFSSKEILNFKTVKYFVKACFKVLWTEYLKAIRV